MKFHGKAGQELRTWILFFVGISLVGFFAWQRNPLNPWWTLIIGAFTCTAIIISAVQTIVGGMNDISRRVGDEAARNKQPEETDKPPPASLSFGLGPRGFVFIPLFRRRHTATV